MGMAGSPLVKDTGICSFLWPVNLWMAGKEKLYFTHSLVE
jgi:hypothetical protein